MRPDKFKKTEQTVQENIVFGRNAVMELLKSDSDIDKIFIQSGQREGSATTIASLAIKKKIPLIEVGRQKLDTMCAHGSHQGVVAVASCVNYVSVEDILNVAKERGEKPFIVIADGIEDPHNLGAIMRTCECAGVHGLIIPKRHSATVTPIVVKASAGANAYLAVCKVPNIASCIEKLKDAGLWIFGAEAGGENVFDSDFSIPAAIVLGGEDGGVSPLVKSKCDFIVSIPMYGKINSLNVSAAGAVILNIAANSRRKQNA